MRKITYLLTLLLLFITGLGVNAQKPFEVSDAPATTNGGRWATNVKWYFLHFPNSDEYHTAGYMGTSGDRYINANGQLLLNGTDKPTSSAGLWCFVGNDETGYKFYNRNTGISKVFSVTTGGVAKMLAEGTNDQNQFFDYTASTSSNYRGKATFKFHGGGNYYLTNDDNPPKCHVGVWNNSDALGDNGSAIDVVAATYDELVEMGLKVKQSSESEKFYFYIKNARSGKYAAFNGSTGLKQVAESDLTNNALWYYTSDGKLHNMGTTMLVNGKEMDETGCTMYIEENILNPGYFCISTTADYTSNCWDDANNGADIGYYSPISGNFTGTSWSIIYSPGSHAKYKLITILNKAKQSIGINPGCYPQTAIDAAQAVLDNTNSGDTEYTTAASTLINAMVLPTQGKYYTITSAYDQFEARQGVTKSIYADSDGNVKWKTTDLTDDDMFWEIYEDNGNYVFKNYGTKKYISTYSNPYQMGETAAANSSFTWFDGGICNINIANGNLHTAGHSSGSGQSGNVIQYGSGATGASAWYIKEVKEPELQKSITRLENGVNTYKYRSNVLGINPGQYTIMSGSVEALQEKITAAETLLASDSEHTSAEYDAALTNLMGAATFLKNKMEVGCYYRIQSTTRSTYTGLQTNDAKMGTSKMWNYTLNEADPSQIWKLEQDGDNYFLVNLASGLYPQYVNGGSDVTTYVGEKNADYKFTWDIYAEATETSMPIHRIYFGGRQVNIENGGHVNYWYAENARHYIWKVAKTEEELLTLVKNWATSQNMTANASASQISLESNVTQVISPNEFAEPAVVNAAIDIVKAYNDAGNPTLKQAQALYNNYKIVDTYAAATEANGSILSVPYTLKAQYGTIILPINYLKPDHVKLYSCNGEENGVLTLIEFTGTAPKNKPYIIEYTDETTMPTAENSKVYQFIGYSNGAATTNQEEGWLTGVLQDETCYVPNGSYILSKYNDKLGFYQVEGDNVKVAAKYKCYLTPRAVQSAPQALFFEGNGTVTDITTIFGGESNQRIEIYNLAGQRIHSLQKGVNIVNGKKVIVR